MITTILHTAMVVKHIKINKKNKRKLERMLRSQGKDWSAISIFALIILVALLGFLISS